MLELIEPLAEFDQSFLTVVATNNLRPFFDVDASIVQV